MGGIVWVMMGVIWQQWCMMCLCWGVDRVVKGVVAQMGVWSSSGDQRDHRIRWRGLFVVSSILAPACAVGIPYHGGGSGSRSPPGLRISRYLPRMGRDLPTH
jgi:hypothetical protein